jgi:hypothetical protein
MASARFTAVLLHGIFFEADARNLWEEYLADSEKWRNFVVAFGV